VAGIRSFPVYSRLAVRFPGTGRCPVDLRDHVQRSKISLSNHSRRKPQRQGSAEEFVIRERIERSFSFPWLMRRNGVGGNYHRLGTQRLSQ
jgi:hypothetical protein